MLYPTELRALSAFLIPEMRFFATPKAANSIVCPQCVPLACIAHPPGIRDRRLTGPVNRRPIYLSIVAHGCLD